MSDFTKQDLGLMHDLITIAWQSGAVKSPQMGQGLEQLRAKVVEKLQPSEGAKKTEEKLKKVQ